MMAEAAGVPQPKLGVPLRHVVGSRFTFNRTRV